MALLHSLHQDNKNAVQQDLVLVSVLHIGYSVVNVIIAFVRSKQSKWDATSLFGQVIPSVLASPLSNAKEIVNGATAFIR